MLSASPTGFLTRISGSENFYWKRWGRQKIPSSQNYSRNSGRRGRQHRAIPNIVLNSNKEFLSDFWSEFWSKKQATSPNFSYLYPSDLKSEHLSTSSASSVSGFMYPRAIFESLQQTYSSSAPLTAVLVDSEVLMALTGVPQKASSAAKIFNK